MDKSRCDCSTRASASRGQRARAVSLRIDSSRLVLITAPEIEVGDHEVMEVAQRVVVVVLLLPQCDPCQLRKRDLRQNPNEDPPRPR
jgi:hypothetical protein